MEYQKETTVILEERLFFVHLVTYKSNVCKKQTKVHLERSFQNFSRNVY